MWEEKQARSILRAPMWWTQYKKRENIFFFQMNASHTKSNRRLNNILFMDPVLFNIPI